MKIKFIFPALLLITITILVGAIVSDARAESKKTAYIISHFHCDPVWTNTQAGEILRTFSIVHQQLEYSVQEPDFKFILSEIDYLKPYWDAYPQDRATILRLAREGRIEFTGGYCEPDEAAVGGESLIRNYIYGKIFKESYFGAEVVTAAQHDVFGHAAQLPQILLGTGHEYAQFTRGNLTDMPSEFYWLSPDGSSILTKRIEYGGSASEASFLIRDSSYYDLTNNAMFMSGGDFSEPDRTIGLRLKKTKTYSIISGTHAEFFKAVESELEKTGVVAPEISRDHTPLLVGCYTSRIDTKWANRLVENLLYEAETFNTFNSLLTGAPYPWLELDNAWRLLLFNSHHDALTGSSTENVNMDLLTGFHEAASLAQIALDHSLSGLAKNIDTASSAPGNPKAIPVIIFNPLNWDRSDPVETSIRFNEPMRAFKIVDGDGKKVVFQLKSADVRTPFSSAEIFIAPPPVPQIGYLALYAVPSDSFPEGAIPKNSSGTILENGLYRIEVDPARGGGIKSLYSKKIGREFINSSAGVGNEIYAIKENGKKVESPWSLHTTGQYWGTAGYPAKSIYIETGAVRSRLIIENAPHIEKAKILDAGDKFASEKDEEVLPALVQEIIIYNNSPRIDFLTNMNGYKASDILFKVGFPAALPGNIPVFEERFASITREPNTEDFLFYDFWREPGVKRGREYPAYNWVDLSPTAALSFRDAAGNTVSEYPLYIGEIVVPDDPAMKKLANRLMEEFAKAGITTTPTSDILEHTNEYYGFRITLGAGNNRYAAKLIESIDAGVKAPFVKSIAETGSGIIFIENPASVTSSADKRPIPILIAEGQNYEALESTVNGIISQLRNSDNILLPASANATKYNGKQTPFGLALINNGNPGNSVERNGTMTLSLMRSSTGWPSGRGYSYNWEVENWNHRFRYSILPHAGGWLEAGVPCAGHEFNFPMTAVQTGIRKGALPARSYSFIKIDGQNIIASAIKPAGFPIIDGEMNFSEPRDISLRIYNTGFKDTKASVSTSFNLTVAREADMLDRPRQNLELNGGAFTVELSPFKIQTVLMGTDSTSDRFEPPAPDGKPSAPVYVRYWETNQNAAPAGFIPISVVMEPLTYSDDRTTLKIRVTVASNLKDKKTSGKVTIQTPAGASVSGDASYDLAPLEIKSMDLSVSGLDLKKLSRQYIAARIEYAGKSYEDVLTFSDWKVHAGEFENGAAPETDDSSWETLPLARFWSRGAASTGTIWYRRKMFIPEGMGDMQMTFERPRDAEIIVYINGKEVRREKWGMQYPPLISGMQVKTGQENLIAIRLIEAGSDSPLWGTAFKGSEAEFNTQSWSLDKKNISLSPGGEDMFTVTIDNPFDQESEGTAILVSPIETWREGGDYSLIRIEPEVQNYSLKPGEKGKVSFTITVPPGAMPGKYAAAVKIVNKGKVQYTDTIEIKVK
jgi:alpha-mannosidase